MSDAGRRASFPIRVEAVCDGPALTVAKSRGHVLRIDEPIARHGTDSAMTPLETLLGALAGCTNVILSKIAAERGATLSVERIAVTGHLDPAGVRAGENVPVAFPRIELEATVRTDADDAAFAEMTRDLRHRCPVSHVLRASGSEIVETWRRADA